MTPEGTRTPPPAILASIDLFADLTPRELEDLGARVRRRHYPKGSTLFLQGDPGTCLYLVETGRVKMVLPSSSGKELIVATRGPGEFFGDMALLDGAPRSADAVTAEECQLLVLQRDDFVRFLETHAAAAVRLLAELSRRLRRTMRQQEEASLLDVGARVASALLHLAEEQGTPAGDGTEGIVVATSLTQTALATMVGITRESVNKWVRYYERAGIVRWEKGRLTVIQPRELRLRTS